MLLQATCDHRCIITSLEAKWPGSVHDSRSLHCVTNSSRVWQLSLTHTLYTNVVGAAATRVCREPPSTPTIKGRPSLLLRAG
ncbi:hypothetical protein F7725_010602 [Dissostichus mawsoni]|uniref:Uncharacterized protein n=1 Tax=Dissostichus mawsoni TaxID=36200 RepID=A0A7J5XP29_DISMA|nr:hypothetical protein F7725_010602 [Dissostichus mawsoni]